MGGRGEQRTPELLYQINVPSKNLLIHICNVALREFYSKMWAHIHAFSCLDFFLFNLSVFSSTANATKVWLNQ
jgi:hypothetical protein